MYIRIGTLILFFLLLGINSKAQKAIVVPKNVSHLIAGVDNYISIVAQQNDTVSEDQVKAFFYFGYEEKQPLEIYKKYGSFIVRPKSLGMVEFHITVNGSIEISKIRAKPIPAVGRLGWHGADNKKAISIDEMKAQRGLIANIECCGFDAKCKVLGFEMIRIPKNEPAKKTLNVGGRFGANAQAIIRKTRSEDLYIFRKIRYRCPGTIEPQRLEDMSFEIK